MAKNKGSQAEDDFDAIITRMGKRAYLHWLVDAAEIKGRTGRMGLVRAMPSDAVLTIDGITEYAEVKSSEDATAFRFSLLRTKQSAAAKMILSAGGTYSIFVRSWKRNRWFKVPYSLVNAVKDGGKSSIPWTDLEDFEWKI